MASERYTVSAGGTTVIDTSLHGNPIVDEFLSQEEAERFCSALNGAAIAEPEDAYHRIVAIGKAAKEVGADYVKCDGIELHIPPPGPELPEDVGITNDEAQYGASNMRPLSLRAIRDGEAG